MWRRGIGYNNKNNKHSAKAMLCRRHYHNQRIASIQRISSLTSSSFGIPTTTSSHTRHYHTVSLCCYPLDLPRYCNHHQLQQERFLSTPRAYRKVTEKEKEDSWREGEDGRRRKTQNWKSNGPRRSGAQRQPNLIKTISPPIDSNQKEQLYKIMKQEREVAKVDSRKRTITRLEEGNKLYANAQQQVNKSLQAFVVALSHHQQLQVDNQNHEEQPWTLDGYHFQRDGAADITTLLDNLKTLLLHLEQTPTSKGQEEAFLQETREPFARLCLDLQTLISGWSHTGLKRQQKSLPSHVAEQLLLNLVQLRTHYKHHVMQDEKRNDQSNDSTTKSTMGWLGGVLQKAVDFSFKGDSNNNKDEIITQSNVLIKDDENVLNDDRYGPQMNHFRNIITSIFFDIHDGGHRTAEERSASKSTMYLNRADRILHLVEIMSQLNMEPSPNILGYLISSNATFSLKRVQIADKYFQQIYHSRLGAQEKSATSSGLAPCRSFFHDVIVGYRRTALGDDNRLNRQKAAHRVEEMVLNYKDLMDLCTLEERLDLYHCALIALASGRHHDKFSRVHRLARQALGEEKYLTIFKPVDAVATNKSDPEVKKNEHNTLSEDFPERSLSSLWSDGKNGYMKILHELMIYHLKIKAIQDAKGILELMERIQSDSSTKANIVAKKSDSSSKSSGDVSLTRGYQFMFQYLQRTGNPQIDPQYAFERFQKMTELSILPTATMYLLLLRVLCQSRGTAKAGEMANQVLNQMELQQNYDPSIRVTAHTFREVLTCWKQVRSRHESAAQEADRLLRFMENRSGAMFNIDSILLENDDDDNLAGDATTTLWNNKDAFDASVKPTLATYHIVLATCRTTRSRAAQTEALKIAFEVVDRMPRMGVNPDSDIVRTLLSVCLICIPNEKHQERRQALKKVAQLGRENDVLSEKQACKLERIRTRADVGRFIAEYNGRGRGDAEEEEAKSKKRRKKHDRDSVEEEDKEHDDKIDGQHDEDNAVGGDDGIDDDEEGEVDDDKDDKPGKNENPSKIVW